MEFWHCDHFFLLLFNSGVSPCCVNTYNQSQVPIRGTSLLRGPRSQLAPARVQMEATPAYGPFRTRLDPKCPSQREEMAAAASQRAPFTAAGAGTTFTSHSLREEDHSTPHRTTCEHPSSAAMRMWRRTGKFHKGLSLDSPLVKDVPFFVCVCGKTQNKTKNQNKPRKPGDEDTPFRGARVLGWAMG